MTLSGPKVLEYSARFWNIETQLIIPFLIQDTGLTDVLLSCTNGRLNEVSIGTTPDFTCNASVAAVRDSLGDAVATVYGGVRSEISQYILSVRYCESGVFLVQYI